mmetsp:Transcript_10029/g.8982  ORF Transcript_10029/g.8982 Transcript_10029/m.8982 type:complete len:941 (-) Transcript_10029:906-3728(-)
MSVFQLQEWWTTELASSEDFDHGCMAIGNLDNSKPATDKIAIGSQQGMLRIYNPNRPNYRLEDLMVEENIGSPILQLLIGLFIPSSDLLGLAILTNKKLIVYEIQVVSGKDGRVVSYYKLEKVYEHVLGLENGKHFTAYNMISGSFGGARGREMILVQSLDGKLQIFEQSATAFTRQLVDCILPGPIWYWSRIDAFIVTTSANTLECYKYQVLVSSSNDIGNSESKDDKNKTTGMFGVAAVRSTLVEWTANIGETIRQIVDGHFSGQDHSKSNAGSANNELLVLTDNSIYIIKESGGIIQQRRLETDPSCICAYRVSNNSYSHNFILSNYNKTIEIYKDFQLVWAAKLPIIPIQMSVGNFGTLHGLIVTIDETGFLSINYLGTHPPVTAVVSSTLSRDVDYDKIDEEHRHLLQIIRESQNDHKIEPNYKLTLKLQSSRLLDIESITQTINNHNATLPDNLAYLRSSNDMLNDNKQLVKVLVRLYVSYNGPGSLTNVSIVPQLPSHVHAIPDSVILQNIRGNVNGKTGTPIMIKFYFLCSKLNLPLNDEIIFYSSYTSTTNEPRVTILTYKLPLYLICQPRQPSKNAVYKVTFDTVDIAALPLTDLFDDFLFGIQESNVVSVRDVLGSVATQAMGFQFYTTHYIDISKVINSIQSINNNSTDKKFPIASCNNNDRSIPSLVSILVSKNAGRYRIQSDSLPAIYIIANELEHRLNDKINLSNANLSHELISCNDNLPLEEFYSAIELHFQCRLMINELLSELNDRSHQFRMIQKRLLVRYKDRNPVALHGIDVLMKESYDSIISLSDSIEEYQGRLQGYLFDVIAIAKLVVLMTCIKYNLSNQERDMLYSTFCPDLIEGIDQGWEETVDANLMYLLKTSLAKNIKESASLNNTSLEIPADTATLKKHINMTLDRISKGAKLVIPSVSSPSNNNSTKSNEYKK